MKIVVCIKQVGALSDEVELADDGRDADADYLEHSLNEWDACAIEEALRITESQGGQGEVVAVTVGDEESEESLRRCLAMGAGRAKRVQPAEAAHDPLSIAAMLAEALAGESPDLVLCGVQSSDSVQAATGTMLAELVEMGRVAVVTKVDLDGATGNLRVHRELEGGLIDVVEVAMPALLTIQTGINEPRYATLRAIKQANLKEIEVLESASGKKPCYKVLRMFVPDRGAGAELLGTNAAEVARRVADIVAARLS